MKPLSISERFRLFPIRRVVAAALACAVTPTLLYLAIVSGDSSFVALSLGLGCLLSVSALKPMIFFPFWKHGFDSEAMELHQRQLRQATIGSATALNVLQMLGNILCAIGTILNITHHF